jgi:hypothetical protein
LRSMEKEQRKREVEQGKHAGTTAVAPARKCRSLARRPA